MDMMNCSEESTSSQEENRLDEYLDDALNKHNIAGILTACERGARLTESNNNRLPLFFDSDKAVQLTRALIKAGADVNACYQNTAPLFYLNETSHASFEIARLLLQNGAHPNVLDQDTGETILDKTIMCWQTILQNNNELKTIKALFRLFYIYGVRTNKLKSNEQEFFDYAFENYTELLFTAARENYALTLEQVLEEHKALITREQKEKAFKIAAKYGHAGNVRALLAYDHTLIATTYMLSNNSPFMTALTNRHTDTLIALLEHGACPSSLYNALATYIRKYRNIDAFLRPLATPELQKTRKLMRLLVMHGASLNFPGQPKEKRARKQQRPPLTREQYNGITNLLRSHLDGPTETKNLTAYKNYILLKLAIGQGWIQAVKTYLKKIIKPSMHALELVEQNIAAYSADAAKKERYQAIKKLLLNHAVNYLCRFKIVTVEQESSILNLKELPPEILVHILTFIRSS